MRVEGRTRDGTEVPYQPTADSGYPVSALSVELEPGQRTQLFFRWSAAEQKAGSVFVQSTPVIDRGETARMRLECE